jgi:ABC-type dipeptide/oligopeptide/nickel transport system ATPase component
MAGKFDDPDGALPAAQPDAQILDIYDRLYDDDKPYENARRTGALNDIWAKKILNPAALGRFLREKINTILFLRKSNALSWLFSALIACDPENEDTRQLLQQGVSPSARRSVRFWVLASAYSANASCTMELAKIAMAADGEIRYLARLIFKRDDPELIQSFSTRLSSGDHDSIVWLLRIIRIIPLPELVQPVCDLLQKTIGNQPLAYDVFHALCSPPMAHASTDHLRKSPGFDAVIELFMATFAKVDTGKTSDFAHMLTVWVGSDQLIEMLSQYVERDRYSPLAKRLLFVLGVDHVFVAGYQSDTINIKADHLGITKDVKILAAIMLSRQVQPPLAIGLFGDWGTGKSFFMEYMQDVVKKQVKRAKGMQLQSNGEEICTEIVQIRFNAWHYVDSNLWASLVSNILERLADHVYGAQDEKEIYKTKTARLMQFLDDEQAEMKKAQQDLNEAQVERKEKQAALDQCRLERTSKESELANMRLADITQLVNIPDECTKEIDRLLGELGLSSAIHSMSELKRSVTEANRLRGKVAAIFSSVTQLNGLILCLLAFCIPALFWFIHQFRDCLLPDELARSFSDVKVGVGIFVTWTAIAANWLKNTMGMVKQHLAELDKVKKMADGLISAKQAQQSAAEKALVVAIEQSRKNEQDASQTLDARVAKVEQLTRQLHELKESNSLGYFLKERSQSDDYRKHLGLISMVRRDFEKLEEKLADQNDAQAAVAGATQSGADLKKVDRIILYIDDLDRCPANKVVDVLQAVHLLLAFKLFVVVVGVDSRWLLQSLERHYRELGTELNPQDVANQGGAATPQHYLEKIFQIHYALPRMGEKGYGNMIGSLMPFTAAPLQETNPVARGEGATTGTGTPTGTAPTDTPTGTGTAAIDSVPRQTFEVDARVLEIRQQERDFAARLHALVPTPRAVKRMVNSYRILKAGVAIDELAAFEGSVTAPGSFQIPLLLLAIMIHDAHAAARWFPWLVKNSTADSSVKDVLLATGKAVAGDITSHIENLIADSNFPTQAALLKEWIPRVARFSFDVSRAIE